MIPKEVFDKMTKEENQELAMLSFNGIINYDRRSDGSIDYTKYTVYMGSYALSKLRIFEQQMIDKYGDNK
jgi:hypothetical protein